MGLIDKDCRHTWHFSPLPIALYSRVLKVRLYWQLFQATMFLSVMHALKMQLEGRAGKASSALWEQPVRQHLLALLELELKAYKW